MGARRKGRVLAFQALYRYDMTGQGVAELLDSSWMDEQGARAMTSEATEFAALLVQGTLETLAEVDARITRHLEHWISRASAAWCMAILRVSVYALLHQASIPANVTIDEAVDIAKEYGGEASYRFVNGVLDAVRKGRPERPPAASGEQSTVSTV